MPRITPHRKRVKHDHPPGEVHKLTFSCYRRMPLLTNDLRRRWLAESIDEAADAYEFQRSGIHRDHPLCSSASPERLRPVTLVVIRP